MDKYFNKPMWAIFLTRNLELDYALTVIDLTLARYSLLQPTMVYHTLWCQITHMGGIKTYRGDFSKTTAWIKTAGQESKNFTPYKSLTGHYKCVLRGQYRVLWLTCCHMKHNVNFSLPYLAVLVMKGLDPTCLTASWRPYCIQGAIAAPFARAAWKQCWWFWYNIFNPYHQSVVILWVIFVHILPCSQPVLVKWIERPNVMY